MAAIKVHGSPISTATQRVLACLHEKELDFEFVNVDLNQGEHKKEPYLSLNPFGQVPALEHGDLKLFESKAITQYIAHENSGKGTQLTSHRKQMANQIVWMEVEGQQFNPVASKLNWELVFKNFFGLQADEAVVQEHEAKLAKVLDIYESRLAQSKYLAGGSFTLADLHHLPSISLLMGTKIKTLFESRPHVKAWVADITARPSWAKVLALQGK